MPLLPNRLTLMQRIQDAAGHGYTHYTMGQIPPDRWHGLEAKFARAYDTDLAKSTRSRWRRSGHSVAQLYGCSPPPYAPTEPVVWVLMATPGRGRIHVRELMDEIEAKRIVLDGYELVHDGSTWTWQMTQARYRYWRELIHTIAGRGPERRRYGTDEQGRYDAEIERVMDQLYNTPGFRLVRRQVGHLLHYARRQWKELRPKAGPQIRRRDFLPYVQRLPNSQKPSKGR